MALQNLGWVANDLKDYPTAQDYYEQSLVITQAISDLEGEGDSLAGLGDALAGLKRWEAASEAYLEAMGVFEDFDAEWGIAGSRSGLARVALAQGNVVGALELVDAILSYLEQGKGLYESLRVSYLTCIQVLQAAGNPRASAVLNDAYAQIQEMADKIKDVAMQQSFLENVPWNRELVRLWGEQHGD
jgi:tetratricopeptide (TPR) repeat protein